MKNFKWDDVEFTIEKTGSGISLSVGRTPEARATDFLKRLTLGDYLLIGGVLYVVAKSFKRR